MRNSFDDHLRTRAERVGYTEEKHYKGRVCVHGHDHGGFSWRHIGHRNCVDCTREGARRWRANNLERAAQNTRRRDAKRGDRAARTRWPITVQLQGARTRARTKNIPFDLTPDFLKELWREQGGRCYWTGVEMDFFIGGPRHAMRPSLDRLVPSEGYTRGNVVWASGFANRARGDLSPEEFAAALRVVVAAYTERLT